MQLWEGFKSIIISTNLPLTSYTLTIYHLIIFTFLAIFISNIYKGCYYIILSGSNILPSLSCSKFSLSSLLDILQNQFIHSHTPHTSSLKFTLKFS